MSNKVSQSTLKQYNSTYRLFCSDLNLNDPYGSFLKLCYKVSQRSKQIISNETIKTALSAIVYNLREKNYSNDIIKEYLLLISHMRKICMYKTQNPILNAEKIPEWSYLLEMKDYWRESNEVNADIYYVLAGVYTIVPPRRIADYVNMFIYNGDENPINPVNLKNINDTKNYFYYNTTFENTPAYFIFNNYKTKKTYGSQIFKVPDELKFMILEYIDNRKLKHNTNLFLLKTTEGQGKIQFYRLLQNTFQCSVDAIRHSYISHIFDNGIPSTQELKNNSIFMAHSISMHLDYRKILQTKDDKEVIINIDPELLNYINPNSIYAKKLLKFDTEYNKLLNFFKTLFFIIFFKNGLKLQEYEKLVNLKVKNNENIDNLDKNDNLDINNIKNKVEKDLNKKIVIKKDKNNVKNTNINNKIINKKIEQNKNNVNKKEKITVKNQINNNEVNTDNKIMNKILNDNDTINEPINKPVNKAINNNEVINEPIIKQVNKKEKITVKNQINNNDNYTDNKPLNKKENQLIKNQAINNENDTDNKPDNKKEKITIKNQIDNNDNYIDNNSVFKPINVNNMFNEPIKEPINKLVNKKENQPVKNQINNNTNSLTENNNEKNNNITSNTNTEMKSSNTNTVMKSIKNKQKFNHSNLNTSKPKIIPFKSQKLILNSSPKIPTNNINLTPDLSPTLSPNNSTVKPSIKSKKVITSSSSILRYKTVNNNHNQSNKLINDLSPSPPNNSTSKPIKKITSSNPTFSHNKISNRNKRFISKSSKNN